MLDGIRLLVTELTFQPALDTEDLCGARLALSLIPEKGPFLQVDSSDFFLKCGYLVELEWSAS